MSAFLDFELRQMEVSNLLHLKLHTRSFPDLVECLWPIINLSQMRASLLVFNFVSTD